MTSWQPLPSDAPDLFPRLRQAAPCDACIRFGIGIGVEGGRQVEIPAVRLALRGRLSVERAVDRLVLEVEGWGPDCFAWFRREQGRGGAEYWQGAVEYRIQGSPALTLYFTAPLEGLEISLRQG